MAEWRDRSGPDVVAGFLQTQGLTPRPDRRRGVCRDRPPIVDLRKLEEELGRRRLDEIADVVRALTYGEMMELAASMWNVRPDGGSLTEHNLPAVLYRWSTSRQS